MAPIRTSDKRSQGEASSSKFKAHRSRNVHDSARKDTATPGVQKIKASIRQTRRLLAKEKLAANSRVETERRLKALETELQRAELAKKERAMSTRYHKVKFFERQKVLRKIKQVTVRLSTADGATRKNLESELHNHRIDLNYIMHYPKLKKYISLLPPKVRTEEESKPASEKEAARTDAVRQEIRTWIQKCMEDGLLSSEPELHLHVKGKAKNQPPSPWDHVIEAREVAVDEIEHDEFFGDDDDDEDS